jgi:GNAT superfamily N-acetyltransferase
MANVSAPTTRGKESDGVNIRPGSLDDEVLVLDSWRRSYSDARFARAPNLETFIRTQRMAIGQAYGTSLVLCLVPADDPGLVLGWVCYRPPHTVHWTYVKEAYRRRGFALQLLRAALPRVAQADPEEDERIWATHWPLGLGPGWELVQRLQRSGVTVRFNPAMIWE